MKLVHILLLNLATVAVALVVYDQLRDEAPAPVAPAHVGVAVERRRHR